MVKGQKICLGLCDEHNSWALHVITVADLAVTLGGGLVSVLLDPAHAEVDDVVIAELGMTPLARPGDLVLGVGLREAGEAVEAVRACAASGAAAIALRRSVARRRRVQEAAGASGVAVLAVGAETSWAHLVWLLRGAIDRSATPHSALTDGPVHDDLFVLADAVASLVGGPVTIEDARSRVLAYSARQDVTDAARVSTIIGRRVPEALLAAYRSEGVFRRLATSSDPFLVPPARDGAATSRYVVPVRAGGEWLGSIWVVTDAAPASAVVEELVSTASVVALHLLRLRSRTDVSQRVIRERLRQALTGASNDAHRWLPQGPWRVVALGPGTGLELWESLLRRRGWTQPLLVDIEGRDYAVVVERDGAEAAGSWLWLEALISALGRAGDPVVAGAGRAVRKPRDLPLCRSEALETLTALERGAAATSEAPSCATVDQAWAQVTIDRAVHALASERLLGPIEVLWAHDRQHGSAYLTTLAGWLERPGAPSDAARALHVHPNTLRYRIQRITEVSDLDLSDPDVRLALTLQLHVHARSPRSSVRG